MKSETERASFPAGGAQWEDLSQRMAEFSAKDVDWRGGRAPMFVFKNDATTQEIGQHAYMMFFTENALGGGRAFHGIGRMEREVLDYGLDLLQAPEGAKGVFTPGGSESIFLAVKAARESHRARAGAPRHGLNMVMPDTAHAAFDKAAQVMDLEIRRAPLTKDKRVDPEALRGLIDDHTMLIVGSAPCYPHGVIDPIDALYDCASALSICGASVGVASHGLAWQLKLVLTAGMLVGRLEIVAVLVLFYPRTWIGRRQDEGR